MGLKDSVRLTRTVALKHARLESKQAPNPPVYAGQGGWFIERPKRAVTFAPFRSASPLQPQCPQENPSYKTCLALGGCADTYLPPLPAAHEPLEKASTCSA